ncbi:hypothetical protein [Pseudoxanthomonas sp. USHLN014]|uniref:hypothetical protein n=1 Tax=Pseudoxanthomonas sp. USHLN014 TaxID=3081297 RepID=UPI00301BC295
MSTKTTEDLAEIQNLPIAELAEFLAELDADDLKALRALEDKSSTKRKGALDAIAAALTDKAAADKAGGGVSTAAAALDAAWQAPDYTGPLTITQSEWRHANLKPVTGVATK